MKLAGFPDCHLTYCSNIHPGESWLDVRANLERYVLPIKHRIAAEQPFGIGLRLSARAALELERGPALEEFIAFLAATDTYVFTINGFPYGNFHGDTVKEGVYRPDWLEEERLTYTDRLARLLTRLLPGREGGCNGSVSTLPAAFRPRIGDRQTRSQAADLLLRHAARLHTLREHSGRVVALAIEPEPCCYLETIEETLAFFDECLLGDSAVRRMADLTGLPASAAAAALLLHLTLCLDTCHAAVQFEDPAEVVAQIRASGVRVGKIQLSAGLRTEVVDEETARLLRRFAEDVYLHQVVERRDGELIRYLDLPEALQAWETTRPVGNEWRVHFHVPLFHESFGRLESTRPFVREILRLHRESPITDHLEVETYTWDVLPAAYRNEPVADAVTRELEWVLRELDA